MSSAGRGTEADYLGRYYTPWNLALAGVSTLPLQRWTRILEPSVGSGAWATSLHVVAKELKHDIQLEVMDMDPFAPGLRSRYGRQDIQIGDSLHMTPRRSPELILGNPPYSVSVVEARKSVPWVQIKPDRQKPIPVTEFHVRRALHLVKPALGSVFFLLPDGFLAGRERRRFWRQFPARSIQTVVPRPSFTRDGNSDSNNYALFWWDLSWSGPTTWGRLEWEPER